MRYLEKSPLVTHGRGWGVPWFLFLVYSGYSSPSLLPRLWISGSLLDIHTWSVSIAQFYPSVLVTFTHGQASLMEMQPFVEPPTPMLLPTSLLLAATLLGSSFTTQCLLYFLLSTQLIFKCSCQAAWLLNPMLHCNPQPALTSLKCWRPLTQLSFCAYFLPVLHCAAFWLCASDWCLCPAFSMVHLSEMLSTGGLAWSVALSPANPVYSHGFSHHPYAKHSQSRFFPDFSSAAKSHISWICCSVYLFLNVSSWMSYRHLTLASRNSVYCFRFEVYIAYFSG